MLRIDDIEETATREQQRDAQIDADAAPDLPQGELVASRGIPVFRDCRGQLVWLD
jgi:hypothetical protein